MAKRLSEREIFKTKMFVIKDVDLEFNDGKSATYQILEKRDTALIVPLDQDNNIIFIKEYFTALDEYQYDLPGGRIEERDNALKTANKELQEEIGYKAEKLDKLITVTLSPGYLTQKTHIFLARGLSESKLSGDEGEELVIMKWPLEKFEDLVKDGRLTEVRAIAALYLTRDFLDKE